MNACISEVKRHEVRRTGKPSSARRHVEYEEFIQILVLVQTHVRLPDTSRALLASVLKAQWHMIARLDDMMKLGCTDLFAHRHFVEECVMLKLKWSKNIREERESAEQFVLGSADENLCCLIGLAVSAEILGSEMANGTVAGDGHFFLVVVGITNV